MHDIGWRYHPAARFVLLLASGIATARLAGLPERPLLLLLALLLLLLAVGMIRSIRLAVASLVCIPIVVGSLLGLLQAPPEPLLPPGSRIEGVDVVGLLEADPRRTPNGWSFRIARPSIRLRNRTADLERSVIVQIYGTDISRSSLPSQGSSVSIRGDFTIPRPPLFDTRFDYGAFLRRRGVDGVVTVDAPRDITPVATTESPDVLARISSAFIDHARHFATEHVGGEAAPIVVALLTGDRSGISAERRETFAASGTAHVLALSGLHVGILSLALFVLLSWIPNRWIRLLLFSLVLVAYSLLTGGAPSIVRASMMAIFFLTGRTIGRASRPLNTLALAGLLLLVADPHALFDVGFQLSFAAVGGILLFYARTTKLLERVAPLLFRATPIAWLVRLLLVTLAAQLGTLPLTILYFDGVPILSPITNLAVIPLVTIGFGSALAGFVTSALPGLPDWFGGTAYLALDGMLDVVSLARSMSTATLDLPNLSPFVAVVALATLLWTGLSRTLGSFLARATLGGGTVVATMMISTVATSDDDHILLYPLTRSGGIAIVAIDREEMRDGGRPESVDLPKRTAHLYYAGAWRTDSAGAVRIAERVAEDWMLDTVEIVDVARDHNDSTLIPINRHGPELILRDRPLLLSLTSRRLVARRTIAGEPVLQVPMHARITRPILLESSVHRPYIRVDRR